MGNTDKFNIMANRYDTEDRIKIAGICSDAILSHITHARGKSVIDFGCGTGLVGIDLLDRFRSVLFVDSSENMIEVVKQKIIDLKIKNADTLYFDIEEKDLEHLQTDYIIMVQTLLHIKDTESILAKLYRLLNDEGHLIIIDFDKNNSIISSDVHNGFEQYYLSEMAKNIGFSRVDSETFFHDDKLFMNKPASLFIMNCKK